MRDPQVYLFLFTFFSLAGWLLEFCYRSAYARSFVNPGFSKGPYLPLYGVAAVVLTLCITSLPGPIHPWALGILEKAVLYFVVTTGMELLTGLVFGGLLKEPLWDYSGEALCIKNAVCLKYSCYWVVLAFGFEYVLLPATLSLYRLLDPSWTTIVAGIVSGLIGIDFMRQFSLKLYQRLKPVMTSQDIDEREFNRILQPLMDSAEVRRLAEFKHHWNKNRLEHSLEVAWYGYVLSKRFALDYTASARAGLLHDLFFYDWLTEGPRLHGFRHPRISLANAQKVATLSAKERDIILKHMWPLTFFPPRYPESWIVCMADTYCSIKDYVVLSRKFNEG